MIRSLVRGAAASKRLARTLVVAAGAAFTVALGFACLHYSFAAALARLSYDLPFLWRGNIATSDVVLVYLDEESAKQLNQRLDDSSNRPSQTRLIDRLIREGARLVFYDIVFDAPALDPTADDDFAASIHANGKVILGAGLEVAGQMGGVSQERVIPPLKLLRKAAAGWGLLVFRPIDPDYGVRKIFGGTEDIPSSTRRAAEFLGTPAPPNNPNGAGPRWVNYYGPRDSFKNVSFAQALLPDGLPQGYFRDKIVFVGGRTAISYLGEGRDEFATPYSRFHGAFSTGLEIHATTLLNLLHKEWLTRADLWLESFLVLTVGLVAGGLFAIVRPQFAFGAAAVMTCGIAFAAFWAVWNRHFWFNWLVPALVQIPFGLVWSVGAHYLLESRRRKVLRQAFSFYLSPQMADRIADSTFDLKPGGKVVEATVLFTDLEGFTSLSEDLEPAETSALLVEYFEQTTRCVLEQKGTIIKYIGDAVFAAWGAPINDDEHALNAARAGCALRTLSRLEISGHKLKTRVGIHSGNVLAGNLGSSFRFDYTMIGDAVNFASRLEALNKYLGTQVLISDAVRQQLKDAFVTRRLGEFRVAGKARSVVIHELFCASGGRSGEAEWIGTFEEGVRRFVARDLQAASKLMEETKVLRGGEDGPAEFYLRKIEMASPNEEWSAIIEFSEK